jgi:peptide chain release factor 2
VFQPYTMVKDHRTKAESGNIQAVMDGGIDQFIDAFLVAKWKGIPLESAGEGDEL